MSLSDRIKMVLTSVLFAALLALLPMACSLFTPRNAKSVLSATSIACIFASRITDAPALAKACDVADDLIPLLRDLIGQREGARAAGVGWRPDGGAP